MSADPHIQNPLNTQSLNRYSYVKNNPLSYTDPSGYFFKSLFKSLKKVFKKILKLVKSVVKAIVKAVKAVVKVVKKAIKVIKKYIKPLLAVAVAVIAPYAVAALASGAGILATGSVALSTMSAGMTLAVGAIGGGLAGLVSTGSLKGMLIGTVSGLAFAGIGNHFSAVKSANAWGRGINGLTGAQQIGKIIMHGAVGGTRAVLSGGKFKDGFTAAGFAQTAAPVIDNIDSSAGQVVAAGVVGGIGSELAGGDFESGFYTGVFSRAFNKRLHPDEKGQHIERKYVRTEMRSETTVVPGGAIGDMVATGLNMTRNPTLVTLGNAVDALDLGQTNDVITSSYQVNIYENITYDTYYDVRPNGSYVEVPGFRHNPVTGNEFAIEIEGTLRVTRTTQYCIASSFGCF